MLSGAALLAVTVWLGSTPENPRGGESVDDSGPTAAGAPIEADAAKVLAGGPPGAATESSAKRSPGPLRGLTGAATALSIGDAPLSLELLASVERGDVGSEVWVTTGALKGRAMREAGRWEEAVTALAELAEHKKIASRFPKELLLLELAQARAGYATTLPVADGDAQRRKALKELKRARKMSPIRNLAQMRVLQATIMAQIEGSSPHATKTAAASAVKGVAAIVTDYPNHPMVGVHRMLHAHALERAGKAKEAAAAFRRIVIERAGEPEEAEAWTEYERIAASSRKVNARGLLVTERLEQAVHARVLRRVQRSRDILDAIIADTSTPPYLRTQARSSRAYTAYKQRDFERCADDLRPGYERTGSHELAGRLSRCLERGEMYEEALTLAMSGTKSKRRGTRANAYWRSLQLAYRAGMYAKTEELLDKYEGVSNANRGERAWLRAWLPYRLGRNAEAIEAFDKVPKRSPKDTTRARYFRAKLMANAPDAESKAHAVTALKQLAKAQPWSYYGLQARQRLLDAGVEAGPDPVLEPVADEATQPTRAETTALLRDLDATYGDAWPPVRRMRQLYTAGYLEAARRELRVATTAFLGLSSKTRSEELIVGLGWRAEWKYPKVAATREGRKTLRDKEAKEALGVGLRALTLALVEPAAYARLVPSSEAPRKSRWHPRAYRAAIEREARVREVDPIHLWSLMYTESRFRRHVVSHVGARGALQIMPWTGRQLCELLDEIPTGRFDADTLFDADTNSHLAAYYIAELLRKFQGQGAMAYASYNGGPSNVARWLRAKSKGPVRLELDTFVEEMVFSESYRYAKRVMEVSAAYSMLYADVLPRWSNAVDTKIEDNLSF